MVRIDNMFFKLIPTFSLKNLLCLEDIVSLISSEIALFA